MNGLAILASPRANGKLAGMLDEAVKSAVAGGYAVDRINLYTQEIHPCIGCMKCREDGLCILHDDLAAIREKLCACDVVILAAPTYFANIPGPVKNLFDRLSGAVMGESSRGIPKGKLSRRQKYLLLTACTTPAPFDKIFGQSSGALRAMKEFFKTAGMSQMGTVVFAGSKGKKEIPAAVLCKIRRYF